MCRFILLSVCILILTLSVKANYVRVTRDLSIADSEIYDDHANVNFSIAWDNSWRDDFNWDAVYIFLKCRKKEEQEWHHVYLRPNYHTVSTGYEYTIASNGASDWVPGIFVFRSRNGSGDAAVDITLQWDYRKNSYDKSDFTLKLLEYTAMCIEMVYVPSGSFYAGDNSSNQTFKAAYQPIWEKYDLVKLDGKNTFDSDQIKPRVGRLSYPPENAANHVNMSTSGNNAENAWYSSRADGKGYWQISFPNEVTVRYFGISGVSGYPAPSKFELYGKRRNDAAWTGPIFTGTSADWLAGPADSYPVSKSLKVTDPGPFSDYQIRFYGAQVMVNNISMTDQDLSLSTDFAYLVDNYNTGISLSKTGRGLYADDRQDNWNTSLSAAYPSGFYGFYVMKYEVSQDQYVRFLNKLSLNQQKARTIGAELLNVPKGGFVFGNSHTRPEARNGIVVSTLSVDGSPVVFANNLTVSGEGYSQPDDGLTVACNFLNPYDMLAYADWTGLRPMSEMEFEKAARAAYPETPERGEWAWNSSDLSTLQTGGTLVNPGTASERLKNANVNIDKKVGGPVRCGSFAAGNTSRTAAGASYWGVMELSGNLAEICYNVNVEGRAFQGIALAHGNGVLNADGTTDMTASYWPQGVNSFALRGGSFAGDAALAGISDRTKAWTGYSNLNDRDSTVSFRLAHSIAYLDNSPVMTYLTLENGQTTIGNNLDTICAGEEYTIRGSDLLESSSPSINGGRKDVKKNYRGRCEYIWYFSENGGATWNVIPEARDRDLVYDRFANDASSAHQVWVRRLMITPEYASMSGVAYVNVINTSYTQYQTKDTIQLSNAVIGCLIETVTPAQYTWRWKGQGFNMEPLRVSARDMKYDFYTAEREDFDNLSGMSFPVECEIRMQKCVVRTSLDVYVVPRNEKKVIASREVTLDGSDPTKRCGVLMMNQLDGQIYATVRIGNQCWMAENVRTAVSGVSYIQTGDGNPKVKMGLMYPYNSTVINNVCPMGWSVPSNKDFEELKTYLNSDGNGNAGVKLKAGNYWNVTNGNLLYQGTNSSGFSAFGVGHYQNYWMGRYAFFGTSDNSYWQLDSNTADFSKPGGWNGTAFPIRCIRNLGN